MEETAPDDWITRARLVAEKHGAVLPDRPSVLRQTLAELDELMRSAPAYVLADYRLIDEKELEAETKLHLDELDGASLAWPQHYRMDDEGTLHALAVQIRTVDALLADRPGSDGAPVAGDAPCSSSGRHYVLPSTKKRDFRKVGNLGSTYDRRGVLRHRIIPTRMNGMPVELSWTGSVDPDETDRPLRIGAALTPDLVLDTAKLNGRFEVRGLEAPRWPGLFVEQMGWARRDAVSVAVWPELAVPANAPEVVKASLSAMIGDFSASRLRMVVAGSRHLPAPDGRALNEAAVFNGKGRPIGIHRKVVPFEDEEGDVENLQPGRRVLVVICDGFLASLAICKDFCDVGVDLPWQRMDVDLVVVPSMGRDNTMYAHVDQARRLRIDRDLRTFVVQQNYPMLEGDPTGYVLPALRELPRSLESLRMEEEWSVHELSW